MPIHTIIHEKRKELNLTQEQIATYLGVSAPAVNKWEKGITYPDITLLPPLARLLKIDLNTLLCFKEGPSEQEIAYFGQKAAKLLQSDGLDAALQMMNQKIQEYPHSMALMHHLALMMDGALIMSELTKEEKKPYEDQVLLWYQRIADSDDQKLKVKASYMLTSKYMLLGEFEHAQEMIDLLPEPNVMDKRTLQADLYLMQKKKEDLPKATQLMQRKLLIMAMEINSILDRMAKIELTAGNTQKAKQIANISEKAAKALDMSDYYTYIAPLSVALAQKNIQESIILINALFTAVFRPWKTSESPLYDKIYDKDGEHASPDITYNNILRPLLVHLEHSTEFDFLRGNKEFEKLLEKYREKLANQT